MPDPPPGWLSLNVEAAGRTYVRHVPPASPLRADLERGTAAEEAAHEAASIMGLPDFVYRAEIRRLGSGTRELGDGLIVIAGKGVALQVKSRKAQTPDPDKERRWIAKNVKKALSQGRGTIRQLRREPASLTNRRKRTLKVDGNELAWLICVIVDHDNPPQGVAPEIAGTGYPTVVLLRRDWDFLFEHLKSMHAVVDYLRRVADESIELGTEPRRYYEYATADAAAEPDAIDPALVPPDARTQSTPLLPLAPAGIDDANAHKVLRIIQEDIAESPLGTMTAERDRLALLADIDLLPVGIRAEWGRVLLDAFDAFRELPDDETAWRFRRFRRVVEGDRILQLGLGVFSKPFTGTFDERFGSWVMYRHHQLQRSLTADGNFRTIGVLLTPRFDGLRAWDTTMKSLDGPIDPSPGAIAAWQELWEGSRVE